MFSKADFIDYFNQISAVKGNLISTVDEISSYPGGIIVRHPGNGKEGYEQAPADVESDQRLFRGSPTGRFDAVIRRELFAFFADETSLPH